MHIPTSLLERLNINIDGLVNKELRIIEINAFQKNILLEPNVRILANKLKIILN